MEKSSILTVDLSPLFREGDVDGKKKVSEMIEQACSDCGFFQIVNHGIPTEFLNEALKLSKSFFDFSEEEKTKLSPLSGSLPAGYHKPHDRSFDANEYILLLPPTTTFNIYPNAPPHFKEVLEEMYVKLTKLGGVLEGIINDCLGLPPDYLKNYNNDRSLDLLIAMHYLPLSNNKDNGLSQHEDANSITFVIQDDVGGLQVLKDGDWLSVPSQEGTLVINIGDVIQVMSNKKFKSATHRVMRPKGRSRYSFAFFYSLGGEKWVEPLTKFTKEIGEKPKYKGFEMKEYIDMRMKNKTNPPSRLEDEIHIKHFEITS